MWWVRRTRPRPRKHHARVLCGASCVVVRRPAAAAALRSKKKVVRVVTVGFMIKKTGRQVGRVHRALRKEGYFCVLFPDNSRLRLVPGL